MGDAAVPSCSKGDGTRTGAGTMSNAYGPEGAESKVDITTSDKTNKTLMLVSY